MHVVNAIELMGDIKDTIASGGRMVQMETLFDSLLDHLGQDEAEQENFMSAVVSMQQDSIKAPQGNKP